MADRSFERLYRRHRRDVYGFALRAVRDPDEAEDVTQTAFLNAYRALHRGDRPESPRAWLLTIAQNIARRRYRERASRPREVELDAELPSAGREWNALVARELEGALRRLRPTRREAVLLRDIEGLSYAEIAERMELSRPAVETLLFRARKELQTHLVELGRTPSVVRRRVRSLLALPVPAGLLTSLDNLGVSLSRAPLTRTAGAVAALVLGAGVATQAGPLADEAAADRRPPSSLARTAAPVPEERSHLVPAQALPAAAPEDAAAPAGAKGEEKEASAPAAGPKEQSGSGGDSAQSEPAPQPAGTGAGPAPVPKVVELVPVETSAVPMPGVDAVVEELPELSVPTLSVP